MMKKKATKKSEETKTANKVGIRRKKELNPAEVRKDIAKMVESHAEKMAQAVIDEGEKGQVAQVKFLFEIANIFPAPTDGSIATTEEDSLAKTLLDRLNIPDKPVVADQDEDEVMVIPAKRVESPELAVAKTNEEHEEELALV